MSTTRFAVVSTQRSGSTLIRTALDSHPQIVCAGEVFLPAYDREFSFKLFLRDRKITGIDETLSRRRVVFDFLDWLYGSAENDAAGFKIMYSQFRWLPYKYPMVLDYFRRNDVRILHVVRENLLKLHISRIRARATGVYHSRNEGGEHEKITIDISSLIPDLVRMQRVQAEWRLRMKRYDSLEINYEAYVANNNETSSAMLKFLGVDASLPLRSPLKKVSSDILSSSIENFCEVENLLRRTEFARFL